MYQYFDFMLRILRNRIVKVLSVRENIENGDVSLITWHDVTHFKTISRKTVTMEMRIMIKDTNTFRDLSSFIDHIKTKDNVVGIVEYGGRSHNNMNPGGDYDLTIIFNKPVSDNVTGIHFYIAGIPVDCMLLSINDFLGETPENPFLFVHLNCTILYDRDNTTRKLLDGIKQRWSMPAVLSDCEVNTFRFTFRHILDKLKHRLFHDELYSRYFIFSWIRYELTLPKTQPMICGKYTKKYGILF